MGFSLLLDPQNREVGQKLGLATLFMFTLPVLTFYVAYSYCIANQFKNPDNWAGGAAILMTNVVVGGYCYSAFLEDRDELQQQAKQLEMEQADNDNDAPHPRVGIYKRRTD